ncbi:MAG: GNAT family N-acetyltransferase [Marinifilaceae bacterium]
MLQITQASTTDIPTIMALATDIFPLTYRDILSKEQITYMMEWMYSAKNLHKQIAEDGHLYFIARMEGKPVGYVSIQMEENNLFHLQKLYILPMYQGLHCGSKLFQYAVNYIKHNYPRTRSLELNVNRNNKALQFYLNMGLTIRCEVNVHIGNGYYMNDYVMGMEI